MIRSHHSAVALLILLLVSICATAQRQELPRTRTMPGYAKVETKTGNISGNVVTDSGQPLPNVNVLVRPATDEGLPVTNVITSREGVFKVNGLAPGSYTVNAEIPAYIPKSPPSHPVVQNTGDSVTLVFMKGGVVSGTVTNLKGDPIVAIAVRVEMVVDESGRNASSWYSYESVTDDRGVYRVYGLPSGTYIVAADGSPNYSPTGVNAFTADMPTYAPSSTRETADRISVRVGEETSNVNISYRAERGSTISGVVRATRKGDLGFSLTLTSLAEKGPRWDKHFRDANGEFAIEGIPDGEYHLVATANWSDRDRGQSETMVLNVRSADIEGIELTATALASITGRVVMKQLKEPVADCTDKRQPQWWETTATAWYRVTESSKKKPQFVLRARASGAPNSQGNFTLQDLAAGEYYFGIRVPGQWYLQSIAFAPAAPGGQPTGVTRSWTTVKPGDQLSDLTFTLAQGGAMVRGEITLAEGQTLPDKLTVYLVPAEAAQAEDPLRYFAAPVSTEGNFWLSNIMPGRYLILARSGTEDTRRNEASKLRLPDAAKTRASLRHDAEQAKNEIELKPCQDITFRLPI